MEATGGQMKCSLQEDESGPLVLCSDVYIFRPAPILKVFRITQRNKPLAVELGLFCWLEGETILFLK